MTSPLRPDEMARESEIIKARERTNDVRSGLQTAATLGTFGLAPSIAAKVLPFLNQYIPSGLALKGISKVMPALGNFLKNGMNQGLTLQSGLSFLKESFQNEKPEQAEPPKENRNIIEQYDPELHSYLKMKIGEGVNLLEAGKKALGHSRFKSAIEKITKDHKTSWDAILKTVYGMGETTNPKEEAVKKWNEHRKKSMLEEERERFEMGYGQQQQQQGGQQGPGQQALMAILNKINQKLGQ